MTRHVALLRGINVSGKNLIPMPALREAITAAGFTDVSTYIQSGNVIFSTPDLAEAEIVPRIEQAIAGRFGLSIPTVVRSEAELTRLVAHPPTDVPEGGTLAVMFLGTTPTPEAVARLDPNRSPPDTWEVAGREIVLRCPNGLGRTKLTIDSFERVLGTVATARNWRSVVTLATLVQG